MKINRSFLGFGVLVILLVILAVWLDYLFGWDNVEMPPADYDRKPERTIMRYKIGYHPEGEIELPSKRHW